METFSSLRPVVRAYVLAVVTVGFLVVGLSIHTLFADPIGSEWLVLAGLTVLTGSFSVKVPSINAYISVSEAFVFASVLLFGPEAGTVTVLLECLVILLWMKPQGRPLYRMAFNLAAPAIAIWCAGKSFYLLSGIHPYSQVFTPLPSLFVPLLAFTAAYFLFNSSLVAIAVGLETERSPSHIWLKNFAWLSVNYFSGASLAALIVTYTQKLELSTLAVIVPLLVVSYLTFRTAMGRAEDSYNHLAELNRLYLSTIETLAMAIDAKDQITHGHIRRVQIYAVGLAKHVGVTDEKLLKAVEAAALLHDMGKLAVPEHILNKPGKLTAAEFEKMKLHAGIGADILSAIDFPYPVVPIVRHHHENWDGTGYPSGIRGTDIPIGARILSVVDCFDALTSDRPYRPRLSDDEALAILMERRGTMYDPLVVDTFIRVHRDIAPEQLEQAGSSSVAITEITTATTSGREPLTVTDDRAEAALSKEMTAAIASGDVTDAELLERHIRASVPFELAIVFQYDGAVDQLVSLVAVGPGAESVTSMRVALGERLSGWVAANKRAIMNSDPALDLGELARRTEGVLSHALSTPVLAGKELLGVVALYGNKPYDDEQRRVLEQIAKLLADRLRAAGVKNTNSELPKPLRSGDSRPDTIAPVSSMLCIEVVNWEDLVATSGDASVNHRFSELAATFRQALAANDLLVCSRDGELAALLSRTDAREVKDVARRFRRIVTEANSRAARELRFEVAIDSMLAPIDSTALWDLLSEGNSPFEAANLATQVPSKVH